MSASPSDRALLDEAKRRVGICDAARALGLGELKPNGVQRSPLREDRHESCSGTNDRLWPDLADGSGGDVVTFIQRAADCGAAEAIKRVLTLAGLDSGIGRRVRIIRQTDPAGHRASLAWLESLCASGIVADMLPLDGLCDAQGRPVKDLADLCRRPASHETLRPLAAHICAFIK